MAISRMDFSQLEDLMLHSIRNFFQLDSDDNISSKVHRLPCDESGDVNVGKDDDDEDILLQEYLSDNDKEGDANWFVICMELNCHFSLLIF